MSWIKQISFGEAKGRLRTLYDRIKGPDDNVDNIMLAHSLRPHTMEGHMAIYKYVLHHAGNKLPKYYLEAIGVWVSMLNDCVYCVEHHFAGMARLIDDQKKSQTIRVAMEARNVEAAPLTDMQKAGLIYAQNLTQSPAAVKEDDIHFLRAAGFDDGKILEINQVTAYFCYANRTVLGLGVNIEGDDIGLSPGNSDDPNDWSHR